MHISITRAKREINDAYIAKLRAMYPVTQGTPKELPIVIWAYGADGPSSYSRSIAVPTLSEIEMNYSSKIRKQLIDMANWKPPIEHGRIMLLRGEPGTGKTYAIRALANAWRNWCTMHYISDPETFFGDSPSYMLQVAIGGDDNKHRLLVLEDSGELISVQAKAQTGQGLSRLLNLADGILGQGLQTLILITTNEDIDKLDPAITRPGRSLGTLDFGPLELYEANEWLEKHNVPVPVRGPKKLAELYEMHSGYRISRPEQHKIGFIS